MHTYPINMCVCVWTPTCYLQRRVVDIQIIACSSPDSSQIPAWWHHDVHVAQELRQYLVWDVDAEEDIDDTVTSSLFQAMDRDTKEKPKGKAEKTKRKRKRSSSSSTEKDSDSSSSSASWIKFWNLM